MSQNRLQITRVENNHQSPSLPAFSRSARRQEAQASMERLWLNDPEQFNPERDAVQRKRVISTIDVVKKHLSLEGKRATDLGCGSGVISRLLRDLGAKIDALDIASNALEKLKGSDCLNITAIQDCLPSTRLDDHAYDLVVCTEVVGYLQPKEYRMLFAELSRLINKNGSAICSTSLDLNSENALERFAALAETEFEIDHWVLRYDLLWIKCCSFFEAPARFIKASQDPFEREKALNKRKSLSRLWFKTNTSKPVSLFWRLVNLAARPIALSFRQSDRFVNFLSSITRFIWDESGISHALFIGKRRPMTFPLPANEIPIERKQKREVWS